MASDRNLDDGELGILVLLTFPEVCFGGGPRSRRVVPLGPPERALLLWLTGSTE